MKSIVKIGCGAGFWGDSPEGPEQLVKAGVDYLVMDYLAEITMSILTRMKAQKPELGYATDFVTTVMKPLAAQIKAKKIRVVTNAGGVNPEACRDALVALFKELGVDLSVAVVLGDDLTDRAGEFQARGVTEMFSGEPMPAKLTSVNAYLGAFPIARALDLGADIVLTGRCVDSAVVLGPLIHEFGWKEDDFDLLAAGSLAGHIIECGAQTTGGVFTDWRDVAEDWDRMGFPIAECRADGTFEITKPEDTGGAVTPETVAEQVVYEVGDPRSYLLPDVTCDFSMVTLAASGPDRVRVTGAKGRAPTSTYKVCATYADGYRSAATMMIAGREAVAKAEAVGRAILKRSSRLMHEAGFADFTERALEVIGSEFSYGAQAAHGDAREVILRIAVRHGSKDALQIFGREIYPAATAMAQGLTGFAGGRPEPQPVIRLFSFLTDKSDVQVRIVFGDEARTIAIFQPDPGSGEALVEHPLQSQEIPTGAVANVPLIRIAHGRSGDKGDTANIGVIARDEKFVPIIRRALTEQAVGQYFQHILRGKVTRFEWPGLTGFNFVMENALGGGGVASLRNDPQGKALAQILMDMPVAVPVRLLEDNGQRNGRKVSA
ncbi:acyclic terpene utilization AtuA family protein [Rhizobium sp. TH2]|uniref:acyclic terpene utilization AtuA family protein n=1 Tax=Rhizobium sp. TH2 TaxID=2775403 RepID=UPI00215722B6|nr:acyclic terpene utilization AtuA family protein [Rhizobium sp. TH2]